MGTLNRTMSSQTERLIKGMEHLVGATNEIFTSLTQTYGEEVGEKMFEANYEPSLTNILTALKMDIGTSMEIAMHDFGRNEF